MRRLLMLATVIGVSYAAGVLGLGPVLPLVAGLAVLGGHNV